MATVRLLLGLWALGVVSLLPVAWTQVTSECPMIRTNEIGSTVSPSTNGLIARSYVLQAGDNPQPPNVQLFVSNIVCLATGPTRERYRSVSLVANFSCSGAVCNNSNVASQVAQFHFECILGAWTASSQGSTDFLRTDSPVGTLSTALRRDCSLCIDPMQLPQQLVDQSTHCLRKCILVRQTGKCCRCIILSQHPPTLSLYSMSCSLHWHPHLPILSS